MQKRPVTTFLLNGQSSGQIQVYETSSTSALNNRKKITKLRWQCFTATKFTFPSIIMTLKKAMVQLYEKSYDTN